MASEEEESTTISATAAASAASTATTGASTGTLPPVGLASRGEQEARMSQTRTSGDTADTSSAAASAAAGDDAAAAATTLMANTALQQGNGNGDGSKTTAVNGDGQNHGNDDDDNGSGTGDGHTHRDDGPDDSQGGAEVSSASVLAQSTTPTYTCPASGCSKSYASAQRLRGHVRNDHIDEEKQLLPVVEDMLKNTPTVPMNCDVCGRKFKSRKSCMDHKRYKHPDKYKGRSNFKCSQCPDSAQRFGGVRKLIAHMEDEHPDHLKQVYHEHVFPSTEAYEEWLEGEEAESYATYIREKWKRTRGKEYWDDYRMEVVARSVWICCSDRYPPATPRTQRKSRSKESKCVGHCPARLFLSRARNGRVRCCFFGEHTHDLSVEHARLPRKVRDEAKQWLMLDLPKQAIVQLLQNKYPPTHRGFYISPDDLRNMDEKSKPPVYGDPATALHALATKLNGIGEEGVVRSLKLPGSVQFAVSGFDASITHFAQDDAVFVYQSPWQQDMLQKHGPQYIGVDTTHSTNQDSYHLFTVVTRDEHGFGLAVGQCLTKHKTQQAMEHCLRNLVQAHGVYPRVVVTNDEPTEINGVQSVLGQFSRHYLCVDNVKRTLRRQVPSMCKDRRAGVHIYKAMALLASTRDVSEFEYGWEALVHRFRETEPDTVVHLREMYYHRKQLWALAFRGPDEEVTNNVVEPYHFLFKRSLLESRTSIRPDHLLFVVHEFTVHHQGQWATRQTMGDVPSQQRETQRSLMQGQNVPSQHVEAVTDLAGSFKIRSQSEADMWYLVTPASRQQCDVCSVSPCVHQFKCTCPAFLTGRSKSCKHTAAAFLRCGGSEACVEAPRKNMEVRRRFLPVGRREGGDARKAFSRARGILSRVKRLGYAPPQLDKAISQARLTLDVALKEYKPEPMKIFQPPALATSVAITGSGGGGGGTSVGGLNAGMSMGHLPSALPGPSSAAVPFAGLRMGMAKPTSTAAPAMPSAMGQRFVPPATAASAGVATSTCTGAAPATRPVPPAASASTATRAMVTAAPMATGQQAPSLPQLPATALLSSSSSQLPHVSHRLPTSISHAMPPASHASSGQAFPANIGNQPPQSPHHVASSPTHTALRQQQQQQQALQQHVPSASSASSILLPSVPGMLPPSSSAVQAAASQVSPPQHLQSSSSSSNGPPSKRSKNTSS